MKDNLRYLSINQLSKLTGKDRATIAKRLENVKLADNTNGRAKIYDTQEVLPLIYAAENLKGVENKIQLLTIEQEKEKLLKLRLENEERAGKMVSIQEVVDAVGKEYTFVRMQLKALPSMLAKKLSIESDPVKCNEILTDQINETCNELIADKTYLKKLEEIEEQNTNEDKSIKRITESSTSDSSKDNETSNENESGGMGR